MIMRRNISNFDLAQMSLDSSNLRKTNADLFVSVLFINSIPSIILFYNSMCFLSLLYCILNVMSFHVPVTKHKKYDQSEDNRNEAREKHKIIKLQKKRKKI